MAARSFSDHDSLVGLVCYYCNFLRLTATPRVHRHTNNHTPEMFLASWELIIQTWQAVWIYPACMAKSRRTLENNTRACRTFISGVIDIRFSLWYYNSFLSLVKVFTRCWSMALGICFHSDARASVRSGAYVEVFHISSLQNGHRKHHKPWNRKSTHICGSQTSFLKIEIWKLNTQYKLGIDVLYGLLGSDNTWHLQSDGANKGHLEKIACKA